MLFDFGVVYSGSKSRTGGGVVYTDISGKTAKSLQVEFKHTL